MTLDEYRKARATEVITGLALILWFGMVAAFVIKHAILLGLATLPASLMAGWMIGIGLGLVEDDPPPIVIYIVKE
jgi:hypothetical protein